MSRRWNSLALTGILAGGLSLRVVALGARPVWYDEAFSILLARRSLPEIVAGTAADTMPPLYYFLLHGWMGFSNDLGFLRSLNVLLGVGVIFMAYAWARQVIDRRAGLVAAGLAAISPFLIYQAQELRMYTLLALALAVYAYCFTRLRAVGSGREERIGLWVGLVLSATTALYTHNLAVFTLLAPNLYLVLRRWWSPLARLLLAQATALLLALPWLVMVPDQIAKIQRAFWTPRPGPLEVLQAIITLHYNLPVPDRWIPLAVGGSLLVIGLAGHAVVRRPPLIRGQGPLWSFLLVPPALLLLLSFVMRPLFVPRAFVLSAVAYLVLLAGAIRRAPLPGQGALILGGMVLPLILLLPAQYAFASFPRSPFDQAGAYLERRADPSALILHDNKLSYFPMAVHSPGLRMAFLPDEPGSHNDTLAAETQQAMGIWPAADLPSAVDGERDVWFVTFQRAIDEYEQLQGRRHPSLVALERSFSLRQQIAFNDLLLFHFVR